MEDKAKTEEKMRERGGGNDYKFSTLHIEHGGYRCLVLFDLVSSEHS